MVAMDTDEARAPPLPAAQRDAVYRCIEARRDVRSQFLPDQLPDAVLARILRAGHHAPSVGFMQPWDFVVVRNEAVKAAVQDGFRRANAEAASAFAAAGRPEYAALKLAGIVEAPVGLCVTCDRSRHGPLVLGRTHQRQTDVYSAVCAVQNIWLAARAEGVGVGWVSIIGPDALRAALGIPAAIEPVAYLCLGYVSQFPERPELETAGWLERLALRDVVSFDRFRKRDGGAELVALL